jgi:hypothetical protein
VTTVGTPAAAWPFSRRARCWPHRSQGRATSVGRLPQRAGSHTRTLCACAAARARHAPAPLRLSARDLHPAAARCAALLRHLTHGHALLCIGRFASRRALTRLKRHTPTVFIITGSQTLVAHCKALLFSCASAHCPLQGFDKSTPCAASLSSCLRCVLRHGAA